MGLLDYIESLKNSDNKVEEIADFIDCMQKQFEYILTVKVMFEECFVIEFLHIRNWPRSFDMWVMTRKEELEAKKMTLIEEMASETENVFAQVKEFKKEIKANLKNGLVKLNNTEQKERNEVIRQTWMVLLPKHITEVPTPASDAPPPEEESIFLIPRYISLEWLANECEWIARKLDPSLVVKVFERIDQLRTQYEKMDKMTLVINKRQALLGVAKSDFKDLKEI